jgi:protein kinase
MDRFGFVKEIGRGAYGTVWKAIDRKTNKEVAIKRINRKFFQCHESLNIAEVRCLQQLVHPNIVTLYNAIMENNTLYLVFEWMERDLSHIIRAKGRRFSVEEVRNISFQLFKALTRMHKEGYCHRDLKPENLLVCGDVIKIADFGLAINIPQEAGKPLESYVATRPYRAPELLLGSTDYNLAIDIWAMGAIMVELFTRYPLFHGHNAVNQIHKICYVIGSPNSHTWPRGLALASSLNYSFPKEFISVDSTKRFSSLLGSASAEAIDLIKHLLSWDPENRPTAIEALQHPFFHQCYKVNKPIPPPPLPKKLSQSRYQISIRYHSEARQPNDMQKSPNNTGLLSDFKRNIDSVSYNSYSVCQQDTYVGQFHRATSTVSELIDKTFPGTGTLENNPMVVVKQQMRFDHGNSRPTASTVGKFKSDSEYSIWQQNRSVSFANVASDHFPGVCPKLFNPTVRRQVEFRNSRPTASTVGEFKSDSEYSIWQQNSYLGSYKIPTSLSFANLSSEPFPGMGSKLFNPTVRRQVEGGNSRPTGSTVGEFKSDSEYSTWQQNSYLGSYKIPASLSFANLPSDPFPGMGPKLLNTTVHRQVLNDKINNPKGFGD